MSSLRAKRTSGNAWFDSRLSDISTSSGAGRDVARAHPSPVANEVEDGWFEEHPSIPETLLEERCVSVPDASLRPLARALLALARQLLEEEES
jgi:hypothetical protein